MGETVESFKMAVESEIKRWNGFDRALHKPDREAFEELMELCRKNALAAGNVYNSIIFEPINIEIEQMFLAAFIKAKQNKPEE